MELLALIIHKIEISLELQKNDQNNYGN